LVEKESTQDVHGKEILERNVDDGLQVQREEDGGGSTRQRWMETSGL